MPAYNDRGHTEHSTGQHKKDGCHQPLGSLPVSENSERCKLPAKLQQGQDRSAAFMSYR